MFSSIRQLAKSINIIDKYALSIKYISTIFMRIYTHWYAMSIKTMQFWSVSTSLFLLSEQFQSLNRTGECLRGGIIACLMDLQAIGGSHAIKSCVTQRNVVLRGGARAEYSMHTQASAVSRGDAEHTSSRQSPIWDSDWEGVLESVYSRLPGWAHNYQPLHYTVR